MFDVIGKRRYFYLLSLIITIPGLVFILLTPVSDAGLQFTIDYTGGTRWEIRFEDPNVTPDQVEAVFAKQGLEATAVKAGPQFIEIKTEQLTDLQRPEPSASPARRRAPTASGSPGASASAGASAAPSGSRRAQRQPDRERIARAVRLTGRRPARRRPVAGSLGLARRPRPATPRSRPRASSARSPSRSSRSSGRSPSSAA